MGQEMSPGDVAVLLVGFGLIVVLGIVLLIKGGGPKK